jgi:hypothetical protein
MEKLMGSRSSWSSGVQEFRSSGVQEFRSSGVQEDDAGNDIARKKRLLGA